MTGSVAYCLQTEDSEVSSFHEATKSQEDYLGRVAIQEETEALYKKTWDVAPLIQGRPLERQGFYKIK